MDEIAGKALQLNDSLVALAFLNKAYTGPRIDLTEDAYFFVRDLKNLPLCKTKVGYRVSFRKSVLTGRGVTELPGKKDLKAISEIKQLSREIFDYA